MSIKSKRVGGMNGRHHYRLRRRLRGELNPFSKGCRQITINRSEIIVDELTQDIETGQVIYIIIINL